MNNNYKINTIPKSFLQISYGSLVLVSLFILIINIVELHSNIFYSNYTLFLFFIFSIFTYKIALENTVETFILSFSLVTAFSQRIIITYFFPESIDYQTKLEFTYYELEYAMFFLTLCIGTSLLGFLIARKYSFKIFHTNPLVKNKYINFFFFKFRIIRFLKSVIWFYIILVILKAFIMFVLDVGFTGVVHNSDQSLLHWFSTRSIVVKNYALLGVIILLFEKKIKSLAKVFFAFYFFESILAASRSIFLSIFQTLVIIYYILKKEIKLKYILFSISVLLIFGGASFVLITMLREYFISGNFDFEFNSILLLISRSFSQFEPLLLWMEMPVELYSSSVGFFPDLVAFINSFYIGDLISDNERVNLGKLMVQYGRQTDFNIFNLGGHAENAGPFGITFIYLGLLGGSIYWFVQSFILTTLMNSEIHSLWKFIFITFFAFGPSYYLYINIIFLLQPLIILGFGLILFDFLNKIIGNNSYFLKK